MRIEACVRELAQDRAEFAKGIALEVDARVVKTWVRQFDQVTALLTAMLDDWKELSGITPDGEDYDGRESPLR